MSSKVHVSHITRVDYWSSGHYEVTINGEVVKRECLQDGEPIVKFSVEHSDNETCVYANNSLILRLYQRKPLLLH